MLCLSKNEASREKKSGRGARHLYSQSVKVATGAGAGAGIKNGPNARELGETRFQPTTLRDIDAYTRDSEVTCLNCLKCLEMALPGRKSQPPRERGVQSSEGYQGICDKKQGLM